MSITPELFKSVCNSAFSVSLDVEDDLTAGVDKGVGYFLIDQDRGLGHGLLWASRAGVSSINFVTPTYDEASRALRLAEAYKGIEVNVFFMVSGEVKPAELQSIEPLPVAPDLLLDAANDLVADFGAEDSLAVTSQRSAKITLADGEIVTAAYASISTAGLEIGRVIEVDGVALVEIGVGQADREIHALTSEGSVSEILKGVLDQVLAVRNETSDGFHPLAKLDRAGYLRFKDTAPATWLSNVATDDVFTDSPRAASDGNQLSIYTGSTSPTVYESIAEYLGDHSSLVVAAEAKNISYINETVLGWLDVDFSLKSLD